MKAQIFLLTACLNLSAAVTDLGVISPRHGILLNSETTRRDFKCFEAEFLPSDSTKVVTLTLTNTLITVDDLSGLPSGRTTMGLKSNFLDGSVSDISIYTFDLRRGAAPAPSAVRSVLRAGSDEPKSLISELQAIQNAKAPPPPVPLRFDQVIREPYMPVHRTLMVPAFNYETVPPSQALILPSTNGLDMETGLPTTDVTIHQVYTNAIFFDSSQTNVFVDVQEAVRRFEEHTGSNVVFIPKALPQGTNRTYGQHLDYIEDRKGKRRNE